VVTTTPRWETEDEEEEKEEKQQEKGKPLSLPR